MSTLSTYTLLFTVEYHKYNYIKYPSFIRTTTKLKIFGVFWYVMKHNIKTYEQQDKSESHDQLK